MSAQSTLTVPQIRPVPWRTSLYRPGLFVLLLACGVAVFLFGCNYYSIFPTNRSPTYEGGMALAFLIAALVMKRDARWSKYWPVAYAFFIASAVWFITTLVGGVGGLAVSAANLSPATPPGVAVGKAGEAVGTIAIILVLNRLGGGTLGAIFIRRGNLRVALLAGGLVLVNFATAALMAMALSGTLASLDALGPLLLWGLVFSLANGFMEELWFRGIFLGKLQPLIGMGAAVVLTALLFSIMHAGAFYMSPYAMAFFLLNLFTHGLAMGYLVFKMQNLWGAALYHAACDLWLFVLTAGFTNQP